MAKGGWQEFSSAESLQRPEGPGAAAPAKAQQRVRVQRTKAGKGGKLVTAITGMEVPEAEANGFAIACCRQQIRSEHGGRGRVLRRFERALRQPPSPSPD